MISIFGRALSLIGAGLFAMVLFVTHPGFAFAQDFSDGDADAVEQPDATFPDITGCWGSTDVFNDSQQNSTVMFVFGLKKSIIKKKKSSIDLEPNVSIQGPIKGKVLATEIRFRGHVSATGISQGCNINGTANLDNDGTYSGSFHYAGFCAEHQFSGGEFSGLALGALPCPQ